MNSSAPHVESPRPIKDHFRDECGVVGVWNVADPIAVTMRGLRALQHRGAEGAGIAASTGVAAPLLIAKGAGPVDEALPASRLDAVFGAALQGNRTTSAIGHVRYATNEERTLSGLQPFAGSFVHSKGEVAVAHNGNLVSDITAVAKHHGIVMKTDSDTELLLHLLRHNTKAKGTHLAKPIDDLREQVLGAYSMVLLTSSGEVFAAKDPLGIRPLCVGVLPASLAADPALPAIIFASESVALASVGAEFRRIVLPGEALQASTLARRGELSDASKAERPSHEPSRHFSQQTPRFCLFEFVYFAHEKTHFGETEFLPIKAARRAFGAALAEAENLKNTSPEDAEAIVVPVPHAGSVAAEGYAAVTGMRLVDAVVADRKVRTFLEADGRRRRSAAEKFTIRRSMLEGKRVILVDDSLVRGTTLEVLIQQVRAAGAEEVHLRIASPPILWPCFFGVDTPTLEELSAPKWTTDAGTNTHAMAAHLNADSLRYLSLASARSAVRRVPPSNPETHDLCDACFSGEFPLPVARLLRKAR